MKNMKKILLTILGVFLLAFIVNTPAYAYLESVVIQTAPQSVEFHLEDPMGNISGYTSNGITLQIPAIGLYEKTSEIASGDDLLGEYEKHNTLKPQIFPANITIGKYKLVIYGTTTAINTFIYIHLNWGDNVKWYMEYLNDKLMYPNVVWTYELDVPATPSANGQITLTKVSNPTDLITDINTSNQLGYLGTPGTYQSLLAKAQDAQAKVTAGQPIPAKNVLNALINDINAQKGKQINTIAADILIEDAQYIINHI